VQDSDSGRVEHDFARQVKPVPTLPVMTTPEPEDQLGVLVLSILTLRANTPPGFAIEGVNSELYSAVWREIRLIEAQVGDRTESVVLHAVNMACFLLDRLCQTTEKPASYWLQDLSISYAQDGRE
jgi:hypothetical protein